MTDDLLKAVADLAAERGLTLEQTVAEFAASTVDGFSTARAAFAEDTVQVVRRRSRRVRAAQIPPELIPTKERLLESFFQECDHLGKKPEESWRRAVVRLRITKQFNARGDASDHPIDTMEEAAQVCARLELYPDVLKVEFGQTAYVRFDEDGVRVEFREFLDDIRSGKYDGYALVALRIDRLARTIVVGGLLVERCIAAGIDIVEIAHAGEYEHVPKLESVKYLYIDKFKEGQQEWEKMSARQREKRARKIRKGEIAGNIAGIGHLERLETSIRGTKVVTKIVELLVDPEYQPYVHEWCERLADGETRNTIAYDMNRRAAAGTAPYPPPLIGDDGEDVVGQWYPLTISTVVQAERLIGCQTDADGKLVPSPHIATLVSDDLWNRANAALTQRKVKTAAGTHHRSGPKPSRIGVGILTCEGCGDTAQAAVGQYKCAKRALRITGGPPLDRRGMIAADGNYHFMFDVSIVDGMLRDVTVAVLDSAPELAARGAAAAAQRAANQLTRENLRAQQVTKFEQRARVEDLYIAGDISEGRKTARLAQIDAELRTLAAEIAATVEASAERLLGEGETWAGRWDAEYARPDRAGVPWIQAVLREVWECVTVAVGPEHHRVTAFHEGRLTFVGHNGYSVRREFVAEIARRNYATRLQETRRLGYSELSEKAKDKLVEFYFERELGSTRIAREMNVLAAEDPELGPTQPLTDALKQRRGVLTWNDSAVLRGLRKACAERGIELVPRNGTKISREDRELLRQMTDLHGAKAAAELVNALGKRRPNGQPWTTENVARAVRIDPMRGRPQKLPKEMVDVIEALELSGRGPAEIQVFLASQPQPVIVSIGTINRRLVERRTLRAGLAKALASNTPRDAASQREGRHAVQNRQVSGSRKPEKILSSGSSAG